jgi:sugar phosphate isomerase/epimerase
MEPHEKDLEGIRRFVREKFRDLPKLESRVASQDKKITYLIKKLAKMEGLDIDVGEVPQPIETIESKMSDLKRVLADHGLEIVAFDELGYVRLKPSNEAGFDTLRKLNTVFHVNLLECYFEDYLR